MKIAGLCKHVPRGNLSLTRVAVAGNVCQVYLCPPTLGLELRSRQKSSQRRSQHGLQRRPHDSSVRNLARSSSTISVLDHLTRTSAFSVAGTQDREPARVLGRLGLLT